MNKKVFWDEGMRTAWGDPKDFAEEKFKIEILEQLKRHKSAMGPEVEIFISREPVLQTQSTLDKDTVHPLKGVIIKEYMRADVMDMSQLNTIIEKSNAKESG